MKGMLAKAKTTVNKINAKYDAEIVVLSQPQAQPVVKPIATTPQISKEDLVKQKVAEYRKLVSDILAKRQPDSETIKGPDYIMDANGNFSPSETVTYTDEGILVDGQLETYAMVESFIRETVENNWDNILKSQEKVVSLPKQNPTIVNKTDIPGTPENKDYKEAFKNLEVKGDDLLMQEKLEKSLNIAKKNVELFTTKGNQAMIAKFEAVVKASEEELLKLAEKVRQQQKC